MLPEVLHLCHLQLNYRSCKACLVLCPVNKYQSLAFLLSFSLRFGIIQGSQYIDIFIQPDKTIADCVGARCKTAGSI